MIGRDLESLNLERDKERSAEGVDQRTSAQSRANPSGTAQARVDSSEKKMRLDAKLPVFLLNWWNEQCRNLKVRGDTERTEEPEHPPLLSKRRKAQLARAISREGQRRQKANTGARSCTPVESTPQQVSSEACSPTSTARSVGNDGDGQVPASHQERSDRWDGGVAGSWSRVPDIDGGWKDAKSPAQDDSTEPCDSMADVRNKTR